MSSALLDSTYTWNCALLVFLWLNCTWRNALKVHPCCHGQQDLLFFSLNSIPLYACRPHLLCPSLCWWHVGCLLVLAVVNSATENKGEQLSLWHPAFVSFRCISRSKIAVSHDSSIFLLFWESFILFSIVTAPIYVLSKNAQALSFLHILTITWYVLSSL